MAAQLGRTLVSKGQKLPASGNALYQALRRDRMKQDNPIFTSTDLGKALSQEWTTMSAEEKKTYSDACKYARDLIEKQGGDDETRKRARAAYAESPGATRAASRVRRTDPNVRKFVKQSKVSLSKSQPKFAKAVKSFFVKESTSAKERRLAQRGEKKKREGERVERNG